VDFDDLPEKYQIATGDLPEAVTQVIEQAPEQQMPIKPVSEKGNQANEPAQNNGALEADELPEDGLDLKQHLANLEFLLIKQALEESVGVVAHAATKLKMRRTTLVEKMRKYGIQREGE